MVLATKLNKFVETMKHRKEEEMGTYQIVKCHSK